MAALNSSCKPHSLSQRRRKVGSAVPKREEPCGAVVGFGVIIRDRTMMLLLTALFCTLNLPVSPFDER